MRKYAIVILIAAVAVCGFGGGVLASSFTVADLTSWVWYDGSGSYTQLNKQGLFFSDNSTTYDDNTIRFYGGTDQVVLGTGDDRIYMGAGPDLLSFGNTDDEPALITFDNAGATMDSSGNSSSVVYVSVLDPETDPFMELRSQDVQITADGGDVVIQLNDD